MPHADTTATAPDAHLPPPKSAPSPPDALKHEQPNSRHGTPSDSAPSPLPPHVAPVVAPPPPIDVSPVQQPPPLTRTRSKQRPGRPPNINENSLMRRLECIMAVETGRMAMLDACQHYDISARTFYRWLRTKDRLIQLTGFTEDDFKNGPPPIDKAALSDQIHRMPPSTSAPSHPNPPRLSNQPAVANPQTPDFRAHNALPRSAPVSAQPMALKRRMPRVPQYTTHVYDDKGIMQSQLYHRNTTKMPAQVPAHDDISGKLNSSRMAAHSAKRMSWPNQTVPDIAFRDPPMYPLPDADDAPIAHASEGVKRRKISRIDSDMLDDAVEDVLDAQPHPTQLTAKDQTRSTVQPNGNTAQEHSQPHQAAEDANPTRVLPFQDPIPAAAAIHDSHPRSDLWQGQAFPPFVECSQKHKIEITMGRKKVNLAWYHGASSGDIKAAIVRRFALLPGTQWALVDKFSDEIIISEGIPSGRYQLAVL